MPSFQDSVFLFVLALLLFGPKKLPKLARELGKWMGEFRRASNEFKMQMEEELRLSEQEERDKKIAAMEAAAPVSPVEALPEPEHPHMVPQPAETHYEAPAEPVEPLPIASEGELKIMPPATGLPVAQSRSAGASEPQPVDNALGGLLGSIPVKNGSAEAEPAETASHG